MSWRDEFRGEVAFWIAWRLMEGTEMDLLTTFLLSIVFVGGKLSESKAVSDRNAKQEEE